MDPIQLAQTYHWLLRQLSPYLSYLIYELIKKILEEPTQIREVSFPLAQEGCLGSLSVSFISLLFEFFFLERVCFTTAIKKKKIESII